MVSWLISRYLPAGANAEDSQVRTQVGLRASITCIVCNVILCAAKAIVGVMAGSVSIVADALNNLSDASSNIVSLFGFKLASKPADAEHPYGHGRFEYLASLTVAVLVCAVGINLLIESVQKIADPTPLDFGPVTAAVLLGSMLVKAWMMRLNGRLGTAIDSETLRATAADSRNDVVTTASVLLAAVVSVATGYNLDGIAGLCVGVFICVSGAGLIKDAISPLLGQAPSEKDVNAIRDKILSYEGVLGTHDLMVHDYGPGRRFASAHVEMAGEGDAFANHEVLDTIERDVHAQMGIVLTLHCDPIVTRDPAGDDLRGWIDRQVKCIDGALSVHDVHAENGFIAFDLVRPDDLGMSDEELLGRVMATVAKRCPDAACVITLDSGFVSPQQ